MTMKYQVFIFWFIFITLSSYYFENANGASSIDLLITNNVPVRLYVPSIYPTRKLPLVVYYHGGGFSSGTTFAAPYDTFVRALVDHSNIIAFSVDYRLSPTYDVSDSYDDSWTALKYIASHSKGEGPNPTLNTLADFDKIFLSGDSAGGNIAHNMAMNIALSVIPGLSIKGIALLCPYFWGFTPIGYEPIDPSSRSTEATPWETAARTVNLDDPRINPLVDPNLSTLATDSVLVITGNSDPLVYRGSAYAQTLSTNGYKGKVYHESYMGGHDFFIFYPTSLESFSVHDRVSSFFNSP